jgi:hypothetical protein
MGEKPLPKFLERTIYATPEWTLIRLNFHHPPVRAVLDALAEKGIEAAVDAFHREFANERPPPHRLKVHEVSGRKIVMEEHPMTLARALKELLLSYQPERVKRCPECGNYFFDRTKRANAVHDRKRCTNLALDRKYKAAKALEDKP